MAANLLLIEELRSNKRDEKKYQRRDFKEETTRQPLSVQVKTISVVLPSVVGELFVFFDAFQHLEVFKWEKNFLMITSKVYGSRKFPLFSNQ